MRHSLKIVIAILILVSALYLIAHLFNFNVDSPTSCPPGECSENISADHPSTKEPGRVFQDFLPFLPAEFPTDMPIDPKPVRVVKSYAEAMKGDEGEDEAYHTQQTYVYVTQQSTATMLGAFESYLKNKGFKTTKSEDQDTALFAIYGEKEEKSFVNINISRENQFERMVTISFINKFKN